MSDSWNLNLIEIRKIIWTIHLGFKMFTPLKFNMEPEHDGFQKESPFPGADVQVPC